MDVPELKQKIKAAGLYPIQVEEDQDRVTDSTFEFKGSLEEFLETAKAVKATVIIFAVYTLNEEDFSYESDVELLDEDNGESEADDTYSDENQGEETFDLTAALPSLLDFKKYIGKEYSFVLAAKGETASLNIVLDESWFTDFEQQRDVAIKKLDENREAVRKKMRKQEKESERKLLSQLRDLIDDPEFCNIPTQREMTAYALAKIPDLDHIVDERQLKDEIRDLSDRVKSMKRRR